jgi:hypothetical protein
MKNVNHTIEDLLEILAGLKGQSKIQIESSDATIMHSVARQVFKGTALTDRQFALMKEKLQTYRDQFIALEYNFDVAVDALRQPLRHIDRSKYIKLVDYPDDIIYQSNSKSKFIKVRFPFKKTDIMLINEINNTEDYYHSKGSHEHYFALTESNLEKIGDRFFQKDYTVDDNLKEIYYKIKSIRNTPNNFLPYVEDGKIKNVKDSVLKVIDSEIDNDTLKLYDRRFRYCLDNIDINFPINSLEEKIASRKSLEYLSKPSLESVDQILLSLYNLDRFPMLVVLENHQCEEQLYETVNFFRDLIPTSQQSVLFRQEEGDSGFNQLIKDRKLNNWVDKNTKIVYINNNSLPKILLETDWKPICAYEYNSNNNRNVQCYIKNNCDLIVYREEELSPFKRYSRIYG